jgi:Uma2 family endonuclease
VSSATEFFEDSIAELLERLGDVPPQRVRWHPLPGLATEDHVLQAAAAPRKRLCELIDGVLVEKAVGFSESLLAGYLFALLSAWARAGNLGLVATADGMVRLWAGRIRIPDVAFFSWDRIPERRVPQEPIPLLAPDLAVEILSISNTRREMRLKREDYFHAGVRLVWEIDPRTRTVQVYTSPDESFTLAATDTLEGGAVLPNFHLPLPELFAELDRQG